MHVPFLIVGQGISGTLLSFELWKAGAAFVVMDNGSPKNASLTAAAVINPLAGKNRKPSADASLLIPKAIESYRSLEALLGETLLQEQKMFLFHASTLEAAAFQQQADKYPQYLAANDCSLQNDALDAPFGIGCAKGLFTVDAGTLLARWRSLLVEQACFRQETFDISQLHVGTEGLSYRDIKAEVVIFCEGVQGTVNPFLQDIPFTRNRGDMLLLQVPGLAQDAIYDGPLRLVPRGKDIFWCGSNYTWDYTDTKPDIAWRNQAVHALDNWLRLPYTILDHQVAERPTTAGQKIFAGFHPVTPRVARLNGLGTRGFSAAPYHAAQLAEKLLQRYP